MILSLGEEKNLECHICIYSWKSILANKTREPIFTLKSQSTSQIFPQKFMDYIKSWKFVSQLSWKVHIKMVS